MYFLFGTFSFNLTKAKKYAIIESPKKGVGIIWEEMSYNYYWAYKDITFFERCQAEPDVFDIDYKEPKDDVNEP